MKQLTGGEIIRALRKKRGMTLLRFYHLTGISQATQSRTENGERIPSDGEIEIIARTLRYDDQEQLKRIFHVERLALVQSVMPEAEKTSLPLDYKSKWSHYFPAEYGGDVWTLITPRPENRDRKHRYLLRWGPLEHSNTVLFGNYERVVLWYTKKSETETYPVFLHISLPCKAEFGVGDPIGDYIIDANHNWFRVEGFGFGALWRLLRRLQGQINKLEL
jgi:transcriptional regulator with XRE-family HTH domain